MKQFAPAFISSSFVVFVASALGCGDNAAKDGSFTSTDAVTVGNPAPPPAPPSIGSGSSNEGDMAARREMAEQGKMAAMGNVAGV